MVHTSASQVLKEVHTMATNPQYRRKPNYRGTPRQTKGSYFNAFFAIALFGLLTKLAWSKESMLFSIVFGFLCFIQIFGLIAEFMGINDMQNPITGEWSTTPTGGDPKNLRHIRPVKTSSAPGKVEGMTALHTAVLGAFYNQLKGGVVVSCGDNYMLAIEFDGPYGNGGIEGEMVFVDNNTSAQAVVRERRCHRATELGRNFLAGETIQYIDITNESDFFNLLSKYKLQARWEGLIDVKSGLRLYAVRITK
jgi:hypothetical protein